MHRLKVPYGVDTLFRVTLPYMNAAYTGNVWVLLVLKGPRISQFSSTQTCLRGSAVVYLAVFRCPQSFTTDAGHYR